MFTIGGYPKLGNPILGLAVQNNGLALAKDNLPYTTLGYQNGPGGIVPNHLVNGTRQNLTGVDTDYYDFRQQAAYELSSETHGGDDVGEFIFDMHFGQQQKLTLSGSFNFVLRKTRIYT